MTDTNRSITEITVDLGINHEVNKTAKKELDKSRGEFFEAATKALEEGVLAKRIVEAPKTLGGTKDLIEIWVNKWHPGWRIVSLNGDTVQLEEDPTLKKFVFVNIEDENVYQRNAIQGNPSLDDDALKAHDPVLWERISKPVEYPSLDMLRDFCEFMEIGYPEMMSYVETIQHGSDWPRVLLDPEEISDDDLAQMQTFLIPGSISLRLESPRAAKPEELEDGV